MAETTCDTKSLVNDFNEQHEAPPKYEQLSNYGQAPGYPHVAPTTHNMVVVTQPSLAVPAMQEQRPQAAGYIILSCFVFWCCCWPIGLVAFIFAVMATSDVSTSAAKAHLKVSSIMSIIGIVSGIILIVILVVFYVAAFSYAESEAGQMQENISNESSDFDDYY